MLEIWTTIKGLYMSPQTSWLRVNVTRQELTSVQTNTTERPVESPVRYLIRS